jgi:WD40 repeat protein
MLTPVVDGQIFSLSNPTWTCKIDESLCGLSHAQWAPDSRHILTRTDFNLRLSIWCLTRKAVTYIRQPKMMGVTSAAEQGGGSASLPATVEQGGAGNVKFSNSGQFMAVLTRVDCKDVLHLYSTSVETSGASAEQNDAEFVAGGNGGWSLLKQFQLDTTDCVQLEWSPDDAHILCTDTPLTYGLHVYTPSGLRVASYSAYEHALGIKAGGQAVRWSPRASFLAIGSYDQSVRIFNNATWQLMQTHQHSTAGLNAADGSDTPHSCCTSRRASAHRRREAPQLQQDRQREQMITRAATRSTIRMMERRRRMHSRAAVSSAAA